MKVFRYFLVFITQKIIELEIIGSTKPAKFYRKTKTILEFFNSISHMFDINVMQ